MGDKSHIGYAATILKPRNDVYKYWRNWENLPSFSRSLKSVEDLGEGRTRWTAEGPQGDVTWEAHTTADIPGEKIAWESDGSGQLMNSGEVIFSDAPGDRGTEVVVKMSYHLPGGFIGETVAKLTGNSPEAQIADTVRRFKALLEVGEFPVIEGQPSNQMRKENYPGQESPKVGLR